MNIADFGNIPNITNQITTATPQAGFRCDPSAMVSSGSDRTANSAPLLRLDLADRKGYQEDYSVRDAAETLWKQETQTFNLKDLEDPVKATEIIENMRRQARWDLGIEQGETKDEVISAYIQDLRQNGLDGTINWSGLSRELKGFQSVTPEELEDGLDYLASRYVSALDKLERNYSGEELAAQRAKLEEVYQTGKSQMIDGYTSFLQENLALSDRDAQAVQDSFSAILSEKVSAYQNALGQVHESIAQTGADSVWLKNHDAYVASQLRAAVLGSQSEAKFSVQDLTAAGQIAQLYRAEIAGASSCGRNEATLALNLSMADMKSETLIQRGLVGDNMAALLRTSRAQGHEKALEALNQALTNRENTRSPFEPAGTYAPVNRTVFQGIYNAVMSTYQQNGGNGAEAIRAGVSYGQTATAQARKANPKAIRWGISMETYWKNFYTTPEKSLSPLDKQVNRLMIEIGRTPTSGLSTYQKYANNWDSFIASTGSAPSLNVQA